MSHYLKRLVAPGSWHIPKKVQKFVMKTAPGPHNITTLLLLADLFYYH